jgi:hypothetical protein
MPYNENKNDNKNLVERPKSNLKGILIKSFPTKNDSNHVTKTLTKDDIRKIINKAILYTRKLYTSNSGDNEYEFKEIPIIMKNKQLKQYVLTVSNSIAPIICKSKKECIQDEHMGDIQIGLYKTSKSGVKEYGIYYKNKIIGLIDDSATLLNYLTDNERAFMEHFIGLLTGMVKATTVRLNLRKSGYLTNIKYPVKLNTKRKSIKRKRVEWNSNANVRVFKATNMINEGHNVKKTRITKRNNVENKNELKPFNGI